MNENFVQKFINIVNNKVKGLKFLNLTALKWTVIISLSLAIVIYCPWLVQFILNTLFLITSFVVFLIIYVIVEMIKEMSDEYGGK